MKKYMLVMNDENNEQSATFSDSYDVMRETMINAQCGMGWYCELYERIYNCDGIHEYVLVG